jgi:DNA-binding IclR family transcriptional regulator
MVTNEKGKKKSPAKAVSSDESEPATGVAAVERALTILGAFKTGDLSLSLNTLSNRTGYYKSTILRLLDSLEKFEYVRRLSDGTYRLESSVLRLSYIYRQSFAVDNVMPTVLRELVAQTNESASYYIRSGQQRLCLFRVDSPQVIRDHVRPGDLLPIDLGAGGHILTRFAGGISTAKETRPSQFVSVTLGERHPDTAAVAAPVFDLDGGLAGALNISGLRSRFTKSAIHNFGIAVLHAARTTTMRLGGDASVFPKNFELAQREGNK